MCGNFRDCFFSPFVEDYWLTIGKNSKTLKWPIFCFAPETRIIVDKSKKTKVQEGEDGYGTMYNEKKH